VEVESELKQLKPQILPVESLALAWPPQQQQLVYTHDWSLVTGDRIHELAQ
jgi:hypothetical protein